MGNQTTSTWESPEVRLSSGTCIIHLEQLTFEYLRDVLTLIDSSLKARMPDWEIEQCH